MNNNFKKISAVICSLALIVTLSMLVMGASQYRTGTAPIVDNNVGEAPANLTNNTTLTFTNGYIDLGTSKECGIQLDIALIGAGTGTIDMAMDGSNDATTWASVAPVGVAANGTAPVTLVTNRTMLGIRYLRIKSLANANANTFCTNYVVQVWPK